MNTTLNTMGLAAISRRCLRSAGLVPVFLAFMVTALMAQAPWGPAMQRGIAAATCAAQGSVPEGDAWVVGYYDLRAPSAGMYGPCGPTVPIWNPPLYHHDDWTVKTIGSLYGIAIDSDGDVYVAAHGLHSKTWVIGYHHRYGDLGGGADDLAAAGTIYKLDRVTGAASVFAVIPNQQATSLGGSWVSGPGIGNICYDAGNDQFFATSLEDGRIYRIDNTGFVTASFDPMDLDDGEPGMPAIDELLWGIEVSNNKIYYAVWNKGNAADPGKIRKIDLNGSGNFLPTTDVEVLTVPAATGGFFASVPVADITFSSDQQTMYLGTRTMRGLTDSYNHSSSVHVAVPDTTAPNWTVTKTMATGCAAAAGEAYGGVALGEDNGTPEEILWSTSADMATAAGPHGLFGVHVDDIPVSGKADDSYKVPYDPSFTASGPDVKGSGGDVEIMRGEGGADCEVRVRSVECPESKDEDYVVQLHITNHTDSTALYGLLTPCLDGELPAGAITTQPLPDTVFQLPTPIPPGGATTISVRIPGGLAVSGETVCFRLTLLNRTGGRCCTTKVCVDLPRCDCAELIRRDVECEQLPDGTIKYTITLTVRNRTDLSDAPYAFTHANFLPPVGFSPATVVLSTPIPPGGTGTVKTCYFGNPGPICFSLALHDDTLENCCDIPDICFDLPECGDPCPPDRCAVTKRVVCCPLTRMAHIVYTVCNNCTEARTYEWVARSVAIPGCEVVLNAKSFIESSGSLTVEPGECASVRIAIDCADLTPGSCAGFEICAKHHPDVAPLCCRGVVYSPEDTSIPIVKLSDSDGVDIATDPTTIRLAVENPSDEPKDIVLTAIDEFGDVSFSAFGEAGERDYHIPVRLEPGESVDIEMVALSLRGVSGPEFGDIAIWVSEAGQDRREPALVFPARRAKGLPAPPLPVRAPDIERFQITEIPFSRVILGFSTKAGETYQVQASTDLFNWADTNCSVVDTDVDLRGRFQGNGERMLAVVPCHEEGIRQLFYRVVQVEAQP